MKVSLFWCHKCQPSVHRGAKWKENDAFPNAAGLKGKYATTEVPAKWSDCRNIFLNTSRFLFSCLIQNLLVQTNRTVTRMIALLFILYLQKKSASLPVLCFFLHLFLHQTPLSDHRDTHTDKSSPIISPFLQCFPSSLSPFPFTLHYSPLASSKRSIRI